MKEVGIILPVNSPKVKQQEQHPAELLWGYLMDPTLRMESLQVIMAHWTVLHCADAKLQALVAPIVSEAYQHVAKRHEPYRRLDHRQLDMRKHAQTCMNPQEYTCWIENAYKADASRP